MKECDIFRGVKTYSDPPTYFQGGPDPRNPHDLRPCQGGYVSALVCVFVCLLAGLRQSLLKRNGFKSI